MQPAGIPIEHLTKLVHLETSKTGRCERPAAVLRYEDHRTFATLTSAVVPMDESEPKFAGDMLPPQHFPGMQPLVPRGRAAQSPRRGDPHVVQARGASTSERGTVGVRGVADRRIAAGLARVRVVGARHGGDVVRSTYPSSHSPCFYVLSKKFHPNARINPFSTKLLIYTC